MSKEAKIGIIVALVVVVGVSLVGFIALIVVSKEVDGIKNNASVSDVIIETGAFYNLVSDYNMTYGNEEFFYSDYGHNIDDCYNSEKLTELDDITSNIIAYYSKVSNGEITEFYVVSEEYAYSYLGNGLKISNIQSKNVIYSDDEYYDEVIRKINAKCK